MILALIGFFLFGLWFLLLRPRRGGPHAPPLVTQSPVVPLPIIGHLAEFFRSPNSMIERCTKDVGPVFTIPVRAIRERRSRVLRSNTARRAI